MLAAIMIMVLGCTNDEYSTVKSEETVKKLTTFSAVNITNSKKSSTAPKSRTSILGHEYKTGGDFMWEKGDKIFVKDDKGVWHKSEIDNIFGQQSTAKFEVPGDYSEGKSYEVRYCGNSTSATNVVIATEQFQVGPNNSSLLRNAGDCGSAMTALKKNGEFNFMLDHKASYLCFLPYGAKYPNILQQVYLTKVVVHSDNAIAGTYAFTREGLQGDGSANSITLFTTSSEYPDGIRFNEEEPSIRVASYMVIAPGTHSLTIEFFLKNKENNTSGKILMKLPVGKKYEANRIYDVSAYLNYVNDLVSAPKEYDVKYYMWDAKKNYWSGHEWNSQEPYQPLDTGGHNTNYAGAGEDTDPRFYNKITTPLSVASNSCANCFNANQLSWYVLYGDAHYDKDNEYYLNGKLRKGGIWLKKLYVISNEHNVSLDRMKEVGADGTDIRLFNDPENSAVKQNIKQGKPVSVQDYFFVPFTGLYYYGQMYDGTTAGYFWSSNTYNSKGRAFMLSFSTAEISVNGGDRRGTPYTRYYGCPLANSDWFK